MNNNNEIGRSMIDDRNRITLVKPVIDILNVKTGEYIFYKKDENDCIYLQAYGLHKKRNNKCQREKEDRSGERDITGVVRR